MQKKFYLIALLMSWQSASQAGTSEPDPSQNQAFVPIPHVTLKSTRVALGKRLFHDKQLSANQSLSCADCHQPENGYGDNRAFSPNTQGGDLTLNTPGISYSSLMLYQNWSGQLPSLEAQFDIVLQNPKVMASDWENVIRRLKLDPTYPQQFRQANYQSINKHSIINAVVTFEKSLSVASRFDLYLRGDHSQLTDQEKSGLEKFKSFGCVSCHQGVALGGNLRQKFGVMRDYLNEGGEIKQRDLGYFNHSKRPQDKYFFRVPGLRDVAQTAPYFHDASAATLQQAIEVMFRYQLAIEPQPQDVADIEAFLRSLNGINYEPE